MKETTGVEAGLSCRQQILIALGAIREKGGLAQISDIYEAVETYMDGQALSPSGKGVVRGQVNREAVKAGLIAPYDSEQPGWRLTRTGRAYNVQLKKGKT